MVEVSGGCGPRVGELYRWYDVITPLVYEVHLFGGVRRVLTAAVESVEVEKATEGVVGCRAGPEDLGT